MTMPDAVVVSASLAWTRIRSSSGLIATFVAVVTGIPSWGIESAYSSDQGLRRRGCRNPGRSLRVWHPQDESANRKICRLLALRQGECQRAAILILPLDARMRHRRGIECSVTT